MAPRSLLHGRTTAVVAGASVLAFSGGVGGAVAHGLIDSDDIANQSIRAQDIRKDGVGKQELRPGSVGWFGELNDRTRQRIASLAGEDGEDGADGVDGVDGKDGSGAAVAVDRGRVYTPPRGASYTTVSCLESEYLVHGGWRVSGYAVDDTPPSVMRSAPVDGNEDGIVDGYEVGVTHDEEFSTPEVTISAFCAPIDPPATP